MKKVFVMLHKWGVYGDCGQDVIAVFKDEESAISGFKKYLEDAVEGGDYFLSQVLDANLQRKDLELAEFSFGEKHYCAESMDCELLDEIWFEVHTLQ
jgi:hypothetical protein